MVNKFGFILVCIGFGGASVEKIVIYLIAYYVMSNLILFLVAGKLNISSGVSAINELLIYDRKSMLFIAVGVISTIAFPLTGGYLAKLDLFQVLTSDKLLYALVTILAIPPMAALLKLLLPYIRKEDLIRSDKDEWIKTETASLTISTIFILFSAIFYNYFVTDDSATNDHNAIGHTISYLLSLFTIFGFLYFMRKSLIRHNLEVLDFDWFVRKPLTFFICKVIEILSLCQKKILLYIQSYDSYSIPSYTKHIIYSNWLIGTVISSFIVSLLTLFLLLYL